MTKKVLVAYATKYGSTAEIAEKIGEILLEVGLETEVHPVLKVHNLAPYDAVVLGSAVYMGMWRREIVRFLKKKRKELEEMPVWLFSSGPVGDGDPVELLDGWRFPSKQQAIADRIKPRDIAVFHGVVDPEKMNKIENKILTGMDSPTGDFRDWEAIKFWAQSIADELK